MCERGALTEARMIIRSMAESVFLAYAMCRKEDMVDRLVEDNAKHRKGTANALIEIGRRRGRDVSRYEQEVAAIAADFPADGGPRAINWSGLAGEMDLITLYELAYRQTSGDAAHATLDALHRHVDVTPDGELLAYVFTPSDDGLIPTLKAAMAAIAQLLTLAVTEMGMQAYDADARNLMLEWRYYLGN
jgi:hypothetical protein